MLNHTLYVALDTALWVLTWKSLGALWYRAWDRLVAGSSCGGKRGGYFLGGGLLFINSRLSFHSALSSSRGHGRWGGGCRRRRCAIVGFRGLNDRMIACAGVVQRLVPCLGGLCPA